MKIVFLYLNSHSSQKYSSYGIVSARHEIGRNNITIRLLFTFRVIVLVCAGLRL